jgi:HAD superfamily hydrolase (TIGR01549 family)
MKLSEYDTIILDCDGVILDSNLLKLDAFRDALSDYDNDVVSNFIDYFKVNFGTSRYTLTKVFIEEFLKQEFDENLYQNILNKYSQNCVALYEQSNMTKNFIDFIEKYKDKNFFVASGSDQDELRSVFETRGISKYFVNIFGSPKKKTDIVSDIVRTNNNCVMIGDSQSDMQASNDNKINFIFMSDYSTNEMMKEDKNLQVIHNLGDLI